MKEIKIEALSLEAFAPFGSFANMINPKATKLGEKPVEFFRDMIQLDLPSLNGLSYSTCRIEKRPLIIDILEYHSTCPEGILPLDNDVLVQVAPATPTGDPPPLDEVKVFRIPKGTFVILRPGVWHWAPFTENDQPANILINLPERTYANDCIVVNLEEKEFIAIDNG